MIYLTSPHFPGGYGPRALTVSGSKRDPRFSPSHFFPPPCTPGGRRRAGADIRAVASGDGQGTSDDELDCFSPLNLTEADWAAIRGLDEEKAQAVSACRPRLPCPSARVRPHTHAHQRRRPLVPSLHPTVRWRPPTRGVGHSRPRCAWRVVLSAGACACGIAPHASRVPPAVRMGRAGGTRGCTSPHTAAATKHAAAGHSAAAAAAAGTAPCCFPGRPWRSDLRELRFSPRRCSSPVCRRGVIRAAGRHGERDSAPSSTAVCARGVLVNQEPPHVPPDAAEGQRHPGTAARA